MVEEGPAYEVLLKEGAFEVRNYPSHIVAEVTVKGDRKAAAEEGFLLLFGYISGSNRRVRRANLDEPGTKVERHNESFPMTEPVILLPAKNAWTTRFSLPRSRTLTTLPAPIDPRVHLTTLPATRVAALRFSGYAGAGDVAAKTSDMLAFAEAHQLTHAGPASLARYDPPWVPWFMRRNEILILLEADQTQGISGLGEQRSIQPKSALGIPR